MGRALTSSSTTLTCEHRLLKLGYNVVASVSSGEAALTNVVVVSPDIVLMDIRLAGEMTGTEAGKILWERFGIPIFDRLLEHVA